MATLTNQDYGRIKKIIRRDPALRSEFGAWGLERQVWMDMLQAAEDWTVVGMTSKPTRPFQDTMEHIAGSMTLVQAQSVWKSWAQWKLQQTTW